MPDETRCVIHGRRGVHETLLGVALCKPCARLGLRSVLEQEDEPASEQLALVEAEVVQDGQATRTPAHELTP